MKRVLFTVLICLFSFGVIFASAQSEKTPAADDGKLRIGLSMYTLEYPFYVTMCDAFEKACVAKGWECITTNASTDVSAQLNNCLDLIEKDIDALAITSWYGASLSEVFEECAKKNIPVFLMDTSTIPEGAKFETRIGTVNHDATYVGGLYAGKWLLAKGYESVDTICLDSGDEVSTDRWNGFIDGLEATGIKVNILNRYFSASRQDSMANMEDALTTYKHIDLVTAASAQHSLGAYGACESANRREMYIISMDGEDEEFEMINKKDMFLLTVTQDPAGMARTICNNIEEKITKNVTFDLFQSAPAGVFTQDGSFTLEEVQKI